MHSTDVSVAPARCTSLPTGRPGGRRRWAGPLLLYSLVALAILWPYHSAIFRPAGDLSVVLASTVEAGKALQEGQFPIRVAPGQLQGFRYPYFQYYGNFPFTATGLLYQLLGDPYLAWKLVTLLTLICGGYFTYLFAYRLSHHYVGSVIGGAVFLLSPYLFTDIHARGAFTETVAVGLLPPAFYLSIRAFVSPRRRYILLCAVTWTLLALSHNISYLYSLIFAALFFLGYVMRGRKFIPGALRLALAGGLHVLLAAWYLAPQFATLKDLAIHGQIGSPFGAQALNPLRVLLSPVRMSTPIGSNTPLMGLQVGWPVLAAAILAVAGMARGRAARRLRPTIVRLLALLALSFWLVWTPVDFWGYLPRTLMFVQFSYRLLMFVMLWGSALAACALAIWFARGIPRGLTLVVLALLGLSAASYAAGPEVEAPGMVQLEVDHPNIGEMTLEAYLLAPDALAKTSVGRTTWEAQLPGGDQRAQLAGDMTVADQRRLHYAAEPHFTFIADRPTTLVLPVLYYPHVLQVRDNNRKASYGNAGHFVALKLPPGRHQIRIRFAGVVWANVVSAAAWIGLLIAAGGMGLHSVAPSVGALFTSSGAAAAAAAAAAVARNFPAGAAIGGFIAIGLGAAIFFLHPLQLLNSSPRLRATASSQVESDMGPDKLFDGNPGTAWIAVDNGPAVLAIEPDRPAKLRKIILIPRQTRVYEDWRHIRLVLLLGGKQVYAREWDFPNAAEEPQQHLTVPPTLTDRIELHFSNAVTKSQLGDPTPILPGYGEIYLKWEP